MCIKWVNAFMQKRIRKRFASLSERATLRRIRAVLSYFEKKSVLNARLEDAGLKETNLLS